jgi:aconitase A
MESQSTFIRRPPYFADVKAERAPVRDIAGARILGVFGDMLTTDHISPIGTISAGTPAARYLESLGIAPRDFVNYAARRLNHDVMIRGTFGNIRLRNEMTPDVEGSSTVYTTRRRADVDSRRGRALPARRRSARHRRGPRIRLPARRATGRPKGRGCSACRR